MPLYRHYHAVTALAWMDDDHFVGTVDSRYGKQACYGWTKTGKSFFIYSIGDGHIEKLGSIKFEEITLTGTPVAVEYEYKPEDCPHDYAISKCMGCGYEAG